jgi:chaperonin GroEL (HSP60 family)
LGTQVLGKVGEEGVITVKEECTIGFISLYFITDVKTQKVEFEKPYILSQKTIFLLQNILPALEAAAQAHRPPVVIAEDVGSEALAALILNKLRGQLHVIAIKAPGFGDNHKSILSDISVLIGGTIFTDELDIKLTARMRHTQATWFDRVRHHHQRRHNWRSHNYMLPNPPALRHQLYLSHQKMIKPGQDREVEAG